MATLLTYPILFEILASYTDRGKSTADKVVYDKIPFLINQAERIIITDLKLQGYERTLTQQMTAGVSIYPKPQRWKRTISMSVIVNDSRRPLLPRSYEYLRAYWPDESQMAEPQFYSDHGATHWLIAGTPNSACGWEIKINQLPRLLDDDSQKNWLTEEAPQLLIACALREMNKFIKNMENSTVFDADYQRHLAAFGAEDMQKIMDRTSRREGV